MEIPNRHKAPFSMTRIVNKKCLFSGDMPHETSRKTARKDKEVNVVPPVYQNKMC